VLPAGSASRPERSLAAELRARPGFLETVVFRAAAVLDRAQLEPHLVGMLRSGDDPEALRLALRVLAEELARAHAAGHWKPSGASLRLCLTEIEAEGRERECAKLLASVFAAKDQESNWAGRLLLAAGGEVPFRWVEEQLAAADPVERRSWLEACGKSGRQDLAPEVAAWLKGEDEASVTATGLVTLARLAHAPAREELLELVKAPADARRAAAFAALARALEARELARYGEEALRREDLAASERLALQLGLVRGGAKEPRAAVRAGLVGAKCEELWSRLSALARAPEPADVEAFAAVFPLEGEDAVPSNALLAATLLVQRHPEVEPFLRAALWHPDWDLCVLAGGLLVRQGGTRVLLDELETPPRTARSTDLRRVGFALGEWGGLGVVEELQRSRSESDPILQGALLGALSARAGEERSKPAPTSRGTSERRRPGGGNRKR
jgi:hypothetical protein